MTTTVVLRSGLFGFFFHNKKTESVIKIKHHSRPVRSGCAPFEGNGVARKTNTVDNSIDVDPSEQATSKFGYGDMS